MARRESSEEVTTTVGVPRERYNELMYLSRQKKEQDKHWSELEEVKDILNDEGV